MKTFKMLKETYVKLQKQKKELEETLISITQEVNVARERGDLRENAEYSAAKSAKIDLEKHLADINRKLFHAVIVEQISLKDFVTFGNTVILENIDTKKEYIYQVLGEEEANIAEGCISCDSPLGKQLLGKKANENFAFETPSGVKHFVVKSFSL